jgi:Protein of unknown function (DUF3089)
MRRVRGSALTTTVAVGIVLVLAAGCGSSSPSAASNGAQAASADQTGTVWLCRPGQADDPCASSLRSTIVPASGPRTTQDAQDDSASPFDCFYVYPTVSTQRGDNSDLTVQPAEIGAAVAQASRFSQVCRVWAPMYRQRTESSLLKGLGNDPQADTVAYDSLLSAWKDYLAHDNNGRPIIFIGHSQGSAMLIRLLASQVDPNSSLRARTVVAILPGGNVTVPTGKTVGATFQHLPLCSAPSQTGCVIAYSSFPSRPPADSDFGRPGQGVSLQSDQTATAGVQVACVNPAAIGGGTAELDPYFLTPTSTTPPPPVTTPWVNYPGLYSGTCETNDGATWLQVGTLTPAGRPVIGESLGPVWGFHLDDVNLALGDLVNDVQAQERAFTSSH